MLCEQGFQQVQQMHSCFFSKVWSHSFQSQMSQSVIWATLSLWRGLKDDCLSSLSLEIVELDKKSLKRDGSVRASKHWRAWSQWS